MKRILILSNHSFMLWQFRRELIGAMIAQGMDVSVGVPFGEHVEDFREMGCKMINIPVDRRGINPVRDLSLLRQYLQLLRSMKPDMVITYSIKPNVYAGFCCRILKIPYCVNVQGLGTAFQKPVISAIVTRMYRAACKKAKVVFFENAGNAEFFRRERIVSARQQLVLPGAGINLQHYPLAPYPDNDVIRFLYLGRLMQEKGIDELFSAIKMLYDDCYEVKLDLVGFFEDAYKEQVQELCDLGIARFHGFQADPRPYYAAADCVVLPSYHEGMSNVLLEAAATGRPLITSDIPGCREAVEEEVTGFICQVKDRYALYETMKRMAKLPRQQRLEMGLAGRARMEEIFDKQQVVDATMKAIFKA